MPFPGDRNVSRVNNGAAANRSEVYASRGAEIWFEAKRLIEEKKMILPEDPVFIQQATNRRVEYTATQKLRVESKEAMRNRGVSSPDRADAVFGAMVCAGFFTRSAFIGAMHGTGNKSAPGSAHQQQGESPYRTEALVCP